MASAIYLVDYIPEHIHHGDRCRPMKAHLRRWVVWVHHRAVTIYEAQNDYRVLLFAQVGQRAVCSHQFQKQHIAGT